MSASREKKQRTASTDSSATDKQRREAAEAQKARAKTVLYAVIGVVLAVAAIILILWNNGIFDKNKVAATVNGKNFTVTELGYYYYPNVSMYRQYGITVDAATADTLRQAALDNLHQYAALAAAAEADGFTLSDEGKAEVDNTIQQIKSYAAQSGTTFTTYLHNAYGRYMTESILRTCLTRDMLASEYYNSHADALTYDDAQINAYYSEHAGDLDTFTFSAAFINGKPESSVDDDGNTVEPTDAEKATAMSMAKATAEKLASDARTGDFDALATESAEKDSNSSFNGETTVLGSSIQNSVPEDCKTWLTDPARKPGDITTVEVADSGYWVLKFTDRFLNENSFGDVDIRHILVKAEVAEDATEPTQEAMDAAKAKAQEILDQFNAGDKTSEQFAALATEYSDDPGSKENGGLYEHVTPSTNFFTDFKNWIFEEGRKPGDTGLVENTQAGQQGWHIMYMDKQNELLWRSSAIGSLKGADLNAWTEELETTYPIETNESNLALLS